MKELSQNIKIIREGFKKLPDKRGKEGEIYTIEDIVLSAFSLFYYIRPPIFLFLCFRKFYFRGIRIADNYRDTIKKKGKYVQSNIHRVF